jgi:hypothetical protein
MTARSTSSGQESLCPPEQRPLYVRDIAIWLGLDPDSKWHCEQARQMMLATGNARCLPPYKKKIYIRYGDWLAYYEAAGANPSLAPRQRGPVVNASRMRQKLDLPPMER